MARVLLILLAILIILVVLICISEKRDKDETVRNFAWSLPDDCFLLVLNAPEYKGTTLCYHVKTVDKLDKYGVHLTACIVDINNPTTKKDDAYASICIPNSWILNKNVKLQCFDTETLKNYVKQNNQSANKHQNG